MFGFEIRVYEKMEQLCAICGKQFSRVSNLYKHIRNVHKTVSITQKNLKCCDCNSVHKSYEELRSHYSNVHSYNICKEVKQFNTQEEFVIWKEGMEKDMKCLYVKHTGTKRRAETSYFYYNCHRSSKQICTVDETKKSTKVPLKLPQTCPSTVECVHKNGLFVATLYIPHIGHSCTLKYINLTKNERKCIAEKIKDGISFDKILDDIRHSLTSEASLDRIHLLDRQDLRNIKKEFLLDAHVQMHRNDYVSVQLWVDSMKKLEKESPVLFYKPQGLPDNSKYFSDDDFVLLLMTTFQKSQLLKYGQDKICIDSTHGTNAYTFLLTTVVVVDDFGIGIPVAFLLSSRTDTSTLSFFFKVLLESVGIIKPHVFMSDDAPEFYNSWVSVMGKPANRLLCAWHVDRNWRKNLQKIDGNQELKIQVYKGIRMLLEEQDEVAFKEKINYITQELVYNQQTKTFGEYFINYYVKRSELWAHCYRKCLGINTNMYLEAFHKNLKHIYLGGKKNQRIDRCIHALMKLIRDIMFKKMKNNVKGNDSYKIKLIENSHSRSLNIVDIVELEENVWQVKSVKNDDYYHIHKLHEHCREGICPLSCVQCNICVHHFSCNCPDYYIKFNICKHIHAVASKINNSLNVVPNLETDTNELVVHIGQHNEHSAHNDDNNDRIKLKLDVLRSKMSNTFSEAVRLKLENGLDKLINIAMTEQVPQIKCNEPVNKNLSKQIRFLSKKKRPKPTSTITKPNEEEKQELSRTLAKKYRHDD